VFVEEVGGGGENGLEPLTEFEEEVTTDPNGSEPSSGPEPKSEAASCTVLILSYARSFRDAVLEAKQSGKLGTNVGLFGVHRRGDCALDRLPSALPAARVKKLSSGSSGGGT
jgi:hypothetical protein